MMRDVTLDPIESGVFGMQAEIESSICSWSVICFRRE